MSCSSEVFKAAVLGPRFGWLLAADRPVIAKHCCCAGRSQPGFPIIFSYHQNYKEHQLAVFFHQSNWLTVTVKCMLFFFSYLFSHTRAIEAYLDRVYVPIHAYR